MHVDSWYPQTARKFHLVRRLQVAPSCSIEGGSTDVVERALSSACSSRVYHPESEAGDRKAPHFALWHEGILILTAPRESGIN